MFDFIIFPLLAYLIGSIPSAVWIGKVFHSTDVREHGSKNAGATNTFRVLGKKAGIIVLLMDISKGFIAVFLPKILLNSNLEDLVLIQLMAGACVFIGHLFPIFAQFRGGKGVASSLGIIAGIHPQAAMICLVLFLIVFFASSFVSLGAIVAAFFFPLNVCIIFNESSIYVKLFSVIIAAAVILMHRKNINRIIQGQENKMNLFKK